ncbi:MAG: hypothetical protein EOP64_00370 [Sphingomonas sp.]|nr:MAG: hypothetical protein EOP64_00370 [Sphingomonas sp.]
MEHVTNSPPLVSLPESGKPRKQDKQIVQTRIEAQLFDVVRAEAKKRDSTIRQAIEWGLREFVARSNPEEAARLGIITPQS